MFSAAPVNEGLAEPGAEGRQAQLRACREGPEGTFKQEMIEQKLRRCDAGVVSFQPERQDYVL